MVAKQQASTIVRCLIDVDRITVYVVVCMVKTKLVPYYIPLSTIPHNENPNENPTSNIQSNLQHKRERKSFIFVCRCSYKRQFACD